mmetsp:Transcript_32525/g.54458  ORF Transcript_32525/g.54458 Transcript_32525/m.54458 type:complete len:427 (+) Transcript_32525:299-1579(+)|eukprot:CAMPEP_0178823114 /NCGR_PEP_ID=MMETSP0746-20121128/4963_1 /TAXON_ID=913974 /ORGANISM="Nitzschia punctata, Strain CCMP561" /LENGTH=426 /DNA_ID=CAMNT_0020484685 /DNA_START=107 /DNA_END=1387 /DNA_ORIENTATION=-
MSFRDFASKLREVREQAKVAVKRIELPTKLPTFDDLAAQDEYIHSEEFNVRGRPREYKRKQKDANGDDTVPANDNGLQRQSDESSAYDSLSTTTETSSVWSLLDRPNGGVDKNDRGSTLVPPSLKQDDPPQQSEENKASTPVAVNKPQEKKATPLLSIVADTLQDTHSDTRRTTASTSPPSVSTTCSASRSELDGDNDDDQSIEEDVDGEEDPILSMIQKEKQSLLPSFKSSSRGGNDIPVLSLDESSKNSNIKSSNRFMDDLDRRLETPEEQMEAGRIATEAWSTNEGDASASVAGQSETPYFTKGPFGGLVMNMALRNFNRIVKRSESAPIRSSAPPLARERPQKSPVKHPEDEFQVQSSSSVLGRDDLAQLEQLKSRQGGGSKLLLLMEPMHENRRFIFIAFTMLLAVVVYFLTQKRLEDDVT